MIPGPVDKLSVDAGEGDITVVRELSDAPYVTIDSTVKGSIHAPVLRAVKDGATVRIDGNCPYISFGPCRARIVIRVPAGDRGRRPLGLRRRDRERAHGPRQARDRLGRRQRRRADRPGGPAHAARATSTCAALSRRRRAAHRVRRRQRRATSRRAHRDRRHGLGRRRASTSALAPRHRRRLDRLGRRGRLGPARARPTASRPTPAAASSSSTSGPTRRPRASSARRPPPATSRSPTGTDPRRMV